MYIQICIVDYTIFKTLNVESLIKTCQNNAKAAQDKQTLENWINIPINVAHIERALSLKHWWN